MRHSRLEGLVINNKLVECWANIVKRRSVNRHSSEWYDIGRSDTAECRRRCRPDRQEGRQTWVGRTRDGRQTRQPTSWDTEMIFYSLYSGCGTCLLKKLSQTIDNKADWHFVRIYWNIFTRRFADELEVCNWKWEMLWLLVNQSLFIYLIIYLFHLLHFISVLNWCVSKTLSSIWLFVDYKLYLNLGEGVKNTTLHFWGSSLHLCPHYRPWYLIQPPLYTLSQVVY